MLRHVINTTGKRLVRHKSAMIAVNLERSNDRQRMYLQTPLELEIRDLKNAMNQFERNNLAAMEQFKKDTTVGRSVYTRCVLAMAVSVSFGLLGSGIGIVNWSRPAK